MYPWYTSAIYKINRIYIIYPVRESKERWTNFHHLYLNDIFILKISKNMSERSTLSLPHKLVIIMPMLLLKKFKCTYIYSIITLTISWKLTPATMNPTILWYILLFPDVRNACPRVTGMYNVYNFRFIIFHAYRK